MVNKSTNKINNYLSPQNFEASEIWPFKSMALGGSGLLKGELLYTVKSAYMLPYMKMIAA
jgi:hypothetical protein